MCSSVLGAFSPYIYVPHSPVYSKAIQYVFTLLRVLSTPRGPPARKSSHSTYRFAFTCTVVVVRLFRFQRSLRITFRESISFFYRYPFLLQADRQYRILLTAYCTVRDNSVKQSLKKGPSVETA